MSTGTAESARMASTKVALNLARNGRLPSSWWKSRTCLTGAGSPAALAVVAQAATNRVAHTTAAPARVRDSRLCARIPLPIRRAAHAGGGERAAGPLLVPRVNDVRTRPGLGNGTRCLMAEAIGPRPDQSRTLVLSLLTGGHRDN